MVRVKTQMTAMPATMHVHLSISSTHTGEMSGWTGSISSHCHGAFVRLNMTLSTLYMELDSVFTCTPLYNFPFTGTAEVLSAGTSVCRSISALVLRRA